MVGRSCGIVSMGLPGVATRQACLEELGPATWRGFFCDLPRAVQPSVSRPVDWAGLLVTFVEWVTALCVGKHKWPASLLIDVQNCAIALVGLPPRGKPLLEELSPAPAGLFRASVPLALCNRFCGSVLVWAAFPPPFSAAHMADLAPLRRGFSVAGRRATRLQPALVI